MSFFLSPAGDPYNIARIGGAKAVDGAFILLGLGSEELLEWQGAPTEVAIKWRNAMAAVLSSHRPGRRVTQIDWLGLAATVNESWAKEQGWKAPVDAVPAPGPTAATATPERPHLTAVRADE